MKDRGKKNKRFFKRKVNIRDRNYFNFEYRSGLIYIEVFNFRKFLKMFFFKV